jgi:hypothetical protein
MVKQFTDFPNVGLFRQGDFPVGTRDGFNSQFEFPGNGIQDVSGNYMFGYETDGLGGVNYLVMRNSKTGYPVLFFPVGTDTNISMRMLPKGEGDFITETNGAGSFDHKSLGTGDFKVTTPGGYIKFNTDVIGNVEIKGVHNDPLFSDNSPYHAVTEFAAKSYSDSKVIIGLGNILVFTELTDTFIEFTGILPIENGGTNASTQQGAINALAGSVTSGQYLRGDGTNILMSAIQASDVPTLNQSTTGQSGSVANSAIFNSGGAGDAPGVTYNGSVVRTVSYNTIGASPIAGSASLTTVGTITSGTWNATAIGAQYGGTGQTTVTTGDLLFGSASNTWGKLADVAAGNVLLSGGVGVAPLYGKVSLTAAISGILPIANGGTNASTQQAAINNLAGAVIAGQYLRGNGTNVLMSAIQAADVPTLNQSTTGQAGSVANNITFNSSGSGDATGITYNGSAARAISYNTLGAAPAPVTIEVTGTSQNMSVNTSYIANNASLVTLTLPVTAAVGDFLMLLGKGAGLYKIAQNASQVIRTGTTDTTVGVGGSLTATNRYDCVRLRCITANSDWVIETIKGAFTIA